jgi:hypothetical protein
MNANIEIVNNDLWGVKFSWVKAGFISELPADSISFDNPYAAITSNGTLIFNKDWRKYDEIKQLFQDTVMPLTNRQLKRAIRGMDAENRTPNWDDISFIVLGLMKIEKLRREVKAKKRVLKNGNRHFDKVRID